MLLITLIVVALIVFLLFSRWTKRYAHSIEETFLTNLNSREMRAEYLGEKKPEYASSLLDKDLHLADFDIPAEVEWAGAELRELSFGQLYGVHVVSILRGNKRINIPKATDRIFPQDRIQVIGTDKGLEAFGTALKAVENQLPEDFSAGEMILRRLPVTSTSPFLGKNLVQCGIRDHYHCLVAGIEKPDGSLHVPNAHLPLEEDDILWLVGEHADIDALMG